MSWMNYAIFIVVLSKINNIPTNQECMMFLTGGLNWNFAQLVSVSCYVRLEGVCNSTEISVFSV
jgi:hypothetical protein